VQIIFSHGDYLELKDNSSIIMEKMIIEEYVPGIELQTADATSLSA
jgi:D-alanine-D-alanine ligase